VGGEIRGRANIQYNAHITEVNFVTGFEFGYSVYSSHSAEQSNPAGLNNLAIPAELFGNKFPHELHSNVNCTEACNNDILARL
jgi:hypothetical protein